MRKAVLLISLFFLLVPAAVSAQECDVLVGTWSVEYDDGSTDTWTITEATERDSSAFPCYGSGTNAAGDSFRMYRVTVYPTTATLYMYTEDLGDLSEDMPATLLALSGCTLSKDFEEYSDDYGIASAAKQDCTDEGDGEEDCPAASILGKSDERLDTIRKFRDEVLGGSVMGKALIRAYYNNASSMNDILAAHPSLKSIAANVLGAAVPVMKALVD